MWPYRKKHELQHQLLVSSAIAWMSTGVVAGVESIQVCQYVLVDVGRCDVIGEAVHKSVRSRDMPQASVKPSEHDEDMPRCKAQYIARAVRGHHSLHGGRYPLCSPEASVAFFLITEATVDEP